MSLIPYKSSRSDRLPSVKGVSAKRLGKGRENHGDSCIADIYVSRLFIDFVSKTFIVKLTGLVLARFICMHSWKL